MQGALHGRFAVSCGLLGGLPKVRINLGLEIRYCKGSVPGMHRAHTGRAPGKLSPLVRLIVVVF